MLKQYYKDFYFEYHNQNKLLINRKFVIRNGNILASEIATQFGITDANAINSISQIICEVSQQYKNSVNDSNFASTLNNEVTIRIADILVNNARITNEMREEYNRSRWLNFSEANPIDILKFKSQQIIADYQNNFNDLTNAECKLIIESEPRAKIDFDKFRVKKAVEEFKAAPLPEENQQNLDEKRAFYVINTLGFPKSALKDVANIDYKSHAKEIVDEVTKILSDPNNRKMIFDENGNVIKEKLKFVLGKYTYLQDYITKYIQGNNQYYPFTENQKNTLQERIMWEVDNITTIFDALHDREKIVQFFQPLIEVIAENQYNDTFAQLLSLCNNAMRGELGTWDASLGAVSGLIGFNFGNSQLSALVRNLSTNTGLWSARKKLDTSFSAIGINLKLPGLGQEDGRPTLIDNLSTYMMPLMMIVFENKDLQPILQALDGPLRTTLKNQAAIEAIAGQLPVLMLSTTYKSVFNQIEPEVSRKNREGQFVEAFKFVLTEIAKDESLLNSDLLTFLQSLSAINHGFATANRNEIKTSLSGIIDFVLSNHRLREILNDRSAAPLYENLILFECVKNNFLNFEKPIEIGTDVYTQEYKTHAVELQKFISSSLKMVLREDAILSKSVADPSNQKSRAETEKNKLTAIVNLIFSDDEKDIQSGIIKIIGFALRNRSHDLLKDNHQFLLTLVKKAFSDPNTLKSVSENFLSAAEIEKFHKQAAVNLDPATKADEISKKANDLISSEVTKKLLDLATIFLNYTDFAEQRIKFKAFARKLKIAVKPVIKQMVTIVPPLPEKTEPQIIANIGTKKLADEENAKLMTEMIMNLADAALNGESKLLPEFKNQISDIVHNVVNIRYKDITDEPTKAELGLKLKTIIDDLFSENYDFSANQVASIKKIIADKNKLLEPQNSKEFDQTVSILFDILLNNTNQQFIAKNADNIFNILTLELKNQKLFAFKIPNTNPVRFELPSDERLNSLTNLMKNLTLKVGFVHGKLFIDTIHSIYQEENKLEPKEKIKEILKLFLEQDPHNANQNQCFEVLKQHKDVLSYVIAKTLDKTPESCEPRKIYLDMASNGLDMVISLLSKNANQDKVIDVINQIGDIIDVNKPKSESESKNKLPEANLVEIPLVLGASINIQTSKIDQYDELISNFTKIFTSSKDLMNGLKNFVQYLPKFSEARQKEITNNNLYYIQESDASGMTKLMTIFSTDEVSDNIVPLLNSLIEFVSDDKNKDIASDLHDVIGHVVSGKMSGNNISGNYLAKMVKIASRYLDSFSDNPDSKPQALKNIALLVYKTALNKEQGGNRFIMDKIKGFDTKVIKPSEEYIAPIIEPLIKSLDEIMNTKDAENKPIDINLENSNWYLNIALPFLDKLRQKEDNATKKLIKLAEINEQARAIVTTFMNENDWITKIGINSQEIFKKLGDPSIASKLYSAVEQASQKGEFGDKLIQSVAGILITNPLTAAKIIINLIIAFIRRVALIVYEFTTKFLTILSSYTDGKPFQIININRELNDIFKDLNPKNLGANAKPPKRDLATLMKHRSKNINESLSTFFKRHALKNGDCSLTTIETEMHNLHIDNVKFNGARILADGFNNVIFGEKVEFKGTKFILNNESHKNIKKQLQNKHANISKQDLNILINNQSNLVMAKIFEQKIYSGDIRFTSKQAADNFISCLEEQGIKIDEALKNSLVSSKLNKKGTPVVGFTGPEVNSAEIQDKIKEIDAQKKELSFTDKESKRISARNSLKPRNRG